MTDKRVNTENRKRPKTAENRKLAMEKKKIKRNKSKKLKKLMKKRLIIRNLSFQVTEEKLKEIFSKFGEVLEVNIPLNKDGKKRGFAFLRYKDTKSQLEAMKSLNFQKIEGRPIAIDFAVDKTTYQSRMSQSGIVSKKDTKMDAESDSEDEDKPKINEEPVLDNSDSASSDGDVKEKDKKVNTFLKEFDADKDVDYQSDETSDDSSEDDDDKESQHSESESATGSVRMMKESNDVSEGKTVFIRNISFKNTEEDLQNVMQEYGEAIYCLLCVDPLTDFPRGTAFVKFKAKESADKLVQESSKEPGVFLDGRKLLCTYAVSRGEVSKIYDQSTKVNKDKRNLRLLKCGLIMQESKAAEGVSKTDMAKRAQLEILKKQKLRNVNFFVSDKRLAIHNLPKNITDKDLRILFIKAAGKGAVLKEARVMKDFKKTDVQGHPISRGFGFVTFAVHEQALKALTELNNNPLIFTSQKRPIVEFSVENKVALLSQERKREQNVLNNKRKIEKSAAKEISEDNAQHQYFQKANSAVKGKARQHKGKNFPSKKLKQNVTSVQSPNEEGQVTKSKKKQKKHNKNKNKRILPNKQDHDSLSEKANRYKEKLLNKFQ